MTKILVIEDEQPLLEEILETLSFEGFQTVGALDGNAGLEMVYDFKPDLIISDIAMPEMDGFGVLERLRQNAATAVLPLIFLTAKAERIFMRQGMELGADDYLTKPFTNAELLAAVRTRLNRQHTMAEVGQSQVDSLKHQLASTIALELRTPLHLLSFVNVMLSDYLDSMSPEDVQEVLNSLAYGSQRMGHVVEQMTMYTALEANMVTAQGISEHGVPVAVGPLLEDAATQARQFVYRDVNIPVQVDTPPKGIRVHADKSALKHVLAEIISNALKFSSDGDMVQIGYDYDDTWVWISVTDSGIGISTDECARATEAFYQIGREIREQQGTGLGLTLAQRMIELHGGALHIDSVQGQGTRVEVTLPRLPE